MIFSKNHPEYDSVDWQNWTPVDKATLCFVIQDGNILLIEKKRGLGKGKVNGPGGRMDPGETPADCAVRETREELLVTPLNPRERGKLRFQFKDGYSLECWIFSADGCDGVPTETDEAVPLWISTDAVPYELMWADDILWLPHMLSGGTVNGDFLFDGDEMLGYRLALD